LQHFLLEIRVRDLARCASHAGILLDETRRRVKTSTGT